MRDNVHVRTLVSHTVVSLDWELGSNMKPPRMTCAPGDASRWNLRHNAEAKHTLPQKCNSCYWS